jgi:hypothetical protein
MDDQLPETGRTDDARHTGPQVDLVGRGLLAGMLLGLVSGVALGFSGRVGDQVGRPVLVTVVAVLVGTVAGALVGLVRERRRAARAAPELPPRPELPRELPVDLAELGPPPPTAGARPPGWYADPARPERLRLWDGGGWTAHTWTPRRDRPPPS